MFSYILRIIFWPYYLVKLVHSFFRILKSKLSLSVKKSGRDSQVDSHMVSQEHLVHDDIDEDAENRGWLSNWFRWCPTSMSLLRTAERRILSYVKTPFTGRYVNVGLVTKDQKEDAKIWTISINETSKSTPLVLIHGLGSGLALWALNLDAYATSRPVHAFDLLGFGRSSRPNFSANALDAERELVNSIEEWRKEMQLERFHVLGHSMGGFLATSYAIRFPNRVSHLILADPWGFPEKPTDVSQRYPIPTWVKMIAFMLQPLNPLWGIRVAGPMGPKLIEKARPDLIKKFAVLSSEEDNGDSMISEYIFHCNAQNPTGEAAFHSMMSSFGWAKYPMCNRISSLKSGVPLTMIYGSRSWVDHCPGTMIQQIRGDSYTNVQVIQGAGHHVYADKKDIFNQLVIKACNFTDSSQSESERSAPSFILENLAKNEDVDLEKIKEAETDSNETSKTILE